MHNVITSSFWGDFKTGDNVAYNLKALNALYADETNTEFLIKPIIIQIVSITEATMYDFIFRVKNHTVEGVPLISDEDKEKIRKKNFEQKTTITESATRRTP